MDESWRRRQTTIQPKHATDYLGPDDYRDVFGGPPRSVLLRHFSPSTRHADHSGFRTVTREDNPPYSTAFCKPEFVSTIRCGRNGIQITRREPETAKQSVFYKPGLATSTHYNDNGPVRKREENLCCNGTYHKLDHVSTASSIRKREEHPSLMPVFQKGVDGLSTICESHNSFRIMERGDSSSYETRSDLNAPTHIAHDGFRVMKSEVDDTCFEDAFVSRPVSGQHPSTWSNSSAFKALRREEVFYNDIFGSVRADGNAGLRTSKSRSISKCESESESMAVSSCQEGLLANAAYGYECDGVLSSYASKLRPITIPLKHYDSIAPSTIAEGDSHRALQYADPTCPSSPITHVWEGDDSRNSNNLSTKNKSRCAASSFCCFTPPETLSLNPSFRLSFKKLSSPDNNSPPSVVPLSVPHKAEKLEKKSVLEVFDNVKTEEQDFGSEVNAALDEAIAWAKERFMMQDDAIEHKSENFVSFKDRNATKVRDYAYSKER